MSLKTAVDILLIRKRIKIIIWYKIEEYDIWKSTLRITFYENKNFQGRSHVRTSDSSDLSFFINHCNSIKVENGNWILYEQSNYKGRQYFVKRGEYPDFHQWMGINDSVRSCRLTPQISHHGPFRLRIYEKEDFRGQMMEFNKDCLHVYEHFHEIHSCNVLQGHWMFYEEPNFRGRQYYLKPGEYKRYIEWGAMYPRIGSFKRITH
ncbi:gamma-crystallin 1-like [Eleutherodactylus coqui]|uniref:gamma-crystallin 1-like n=1 Tax=Eleutherodactylus coqui TaxID=57060 RepID=UPI003463600A